MVEGYDSGGLKAKAERIKKFSIGYWHSDSSGIADL